MSTTKQESRAEETKKRILRAAQALFAKKGYESVTMREIAREAGCSHTAIYMYFKDKESLLEHIALPPLQLLYKELQQVASFAKDSPTTVLKNQCRLFVEFGLENQNLYPVYFTVKAERVDIADPKLHINQVRNSLFQILNQSVQKALQVENDTVSIDFTRILFYQIHGMIMIYVPSEEPIEEIKKRVLPLLDQGVEALLRGLKG